MASFILPIISGLAGLFGGQPKQQQQTNTTNTSGTNSSDIWNMPALSPDQQVLIQNFTNDAINKWNKSNQGVDLSGYTAGGLQAINAGAADKSKIMSNLLASRGLSYSPAAAFSQLQPESDRIAQSSQFLSTIPLVQRQFQQQGLDNLIAAFSKLPTGSHNFGSSSFTQNSDQRGTQLLPGNPIAGALSGFGAGLAAPGGPGSGSSNLDNILKMFGIGGGRGAIPFGSPGYQP